MINIRNSLTSAIPLTAMKINFVSAHVGQSNFFNNDIVFLVMVAIGMTVALMIFLLPTIIVMKNPSHTNKAGVVIVNLLLGWTVIGWLIALIWSFQKSPNVFVMNYGQPHPGAAPMPGTPAQGSTPPIAPSASPPRRWKIQLFHDGSLLREVPLGQGAVIIGRAGDVDVQVNDGHMSGRHWQVDASPSGVRVKDLGTTNGTWKNGNARIDSDLAGHGDWYQIGKTQLLVCRVG